MENQINRLPSTKTKIFVLLAFICITFLVYGFINNSLKAYIAKKPTVIVFYLDRSVLHFACLASPKCFSDVDLGVQIKEANNPLEHPLSIDSAYHNGDVNLYVFLTGGVWNYLTKVNLEKSQAQILDLNTLSPSAYGGVPNFFQGMGRLSHNKIVVFTDGKIGILQDNFSLKAIDFKDPIRDFIEANDSQTAFISQLQNEIMQGKVFLVDVNSGVAEERTFDGPQEGGQIVTVDSGIHYLYWVSSDNKTLHLFDIQAQKDVRSVPISASDAYAYTTLTGARYQYHGIWYYSRRCPCEGPALSMMMDMSTLKPVINPEDFLKSEPESDRTFMIAPFGDNFLIGMHSRVLIMSPKGTVIKTYDLPKEWIGRNYLLLEYRK